MSRRVFITAAEVSGDQHAAQLVTGLRRLCPGLVVEGHGGPAMREAGAFIHCETTARAAMGLQAVRRAAEILRLLRWTGRHFDRVRPDMLICVDSPDMNFHFAKLAHKRNIPVFYYIAPQLWAWREKRMNKLRTWVKRVACILPFEEDYFRRQGVEARFVGHPLFDELPADRGPDPAVKYPNRPPIVGLLPGSRRPEALANFPHLLDVAARIRRYFPDVSFRVPTTAATHSLVRQLAANYPDIICGEGQFDTMVPQCDLCLTVSGTATLHVAGYGVPMIVVYRGNAILWHLLGRWLIKTRTFSLVNLLSEQRHHIVPEFVPWYGSNDKVANYAIDLLRHPAKLLEQRKRLLKLVATLDKPGASLNAARMALEMIRNNPPQEFSLTPAMVGVAVGAG